MSSRQFNRKDNWFFYMNQINTNNPDETILVRDNVEISGNTTLHNVSLSGNIIPSTDSVYDIGSATNKIRDLYLSNSTLYMGNQANDAVYDVISVINDVPTFKGVVEIPNVPNAATLSTTINILTVSGDASFNQNVNISGGLTIGNLNNNYVMPSTIGISGQVLSVPTSGNTLEFIDVTSGFVSTADANLNMANYNITGINQLQGASTITIDPAGIGDNTGLVVIKGDLQIDGTTTTVNSTTLDINDKRILLASNATNNSQTDGAGIEVSGNRLFTYNSADITWVSNIDISAPTFFGDISANTLTVNSAYQMPTTIGSASQVLTVPASGNVLEFTTPIAPGTLQTGTSGLISYNADGASSSGGIAIGISGGSVTQGFNSIAIGKEAGNGTQGNFSVAIGLQSAKIDQGQQSISIGPLAGYNSQKIRCVAIGNEAGYSNQKDGSIALGRQSGYENQGNNSISIGYQAGSYNLGNNSIALGNLAGVNDQSANTIVLNATGAEFNGADLSGLYIKPIRNVSAVNALYYNPTSGEISYDLSGGAGGSWVGTATSDLNMSNFNITGINQLQGASTITIDPAGIGDNTGLVVIKGDLQIDGTTTTVNSTTLDINDKRILLASNATNNSQTDGAGIEVSGNRLFTYNSADITWVSNIDISATRFKGDISANTLTVNSAYQMPTTIGSASQVLTVPASGNVLEFVDPASGGTSQTGTSGLISYNATGANSTQSIALGLNANASGSTSVAIGSNSGTANLNGVSVGSYAGQSGQGQRATALGHYAGNLNQGQNSVAIGTGAGESRQSAYSVALGYRAGYNDQSANTIVLNATGSTFNGDTASGFYVKPIAPVNPNLSSGNILYYNPTNGAITYGLSGGAGGGGSGGTSQSGTSGLIAYNATAADSNAGIALGLNANSTGGLGIAIGSGANASYYKAISIGENSSSTQDSAIAFGVDSRATSIGAISIGSNCKTNSIWTTCIGGLTNFNNQLGQYSIAIGYKSAYSGRNCTNCIVLNAQGNIALDPSQNGQFLVKPIRNDATPTDVLFYNTTTGEISYGNEGQVSSDIRFKHNIINIDTGLNIINKLQIKKFKKCSKFNATKEEIEKAELYVGVIAQEVLEVEPELVSGGDYIDDKGKLIESPYFVKNNNLLMYNVKATQELSNLLDLANNKIQQLEAQNSILRNAVNILLKKNNLKTI